MTECKTMRLEKATILRVLHEEPAFSEMFVSHLLARTIRVEADLVDHLFNSRRSVSATEGPSHRLSLHAQARIMAQSDRNLVFHPGAKAHPPRQLRQQGHVEDQDRAV